MPLGFLTVLFSLSVTALGGLGCLQEPGRLGERVKEAIYETTGYLP